MAYSLLTLDIDRRGVASVTLNRPEVRNAFDDRLIAELTQAFEQLDADPKVRLAVLAGNGKSFCAGADLNWMKAMKSYTREENIADSSRLARMFACIRQFRAPLIGLVQGAALGGGAGLAAVCDYVVATEDTKFGFTEVRLGIVPGVISPYVIEKIGGSAARAYFLSGMRFSAHTAQEIGLVHRLVLHDALKHVREEVIGEFLLAGPEAARSAKALIDEVVGGVCKDLVDYTMQAIAGARVSAEGQEGMEALLSGRKPVWADKK